MKWFKFFLEKTEYLVREFNMRRPKHFTARKKRDKCSTVLRRQT